MGFFNYCNNPVEWTLSSLWLGRKLRLRGLQEVAKAAHICTVSNMRSEMDSVCCFLKVHLILLLLLLCLLEKMWEEAWKRREHILHTKWYQEKKRLNLFFYFCLRNEMSIFNYLGKFDQGLTYEKCWVEGWRSNIERA